LSASVHIRDDSPLIKQKRKRSVLIVIECLMIRLVFHHPEAKHFRSAAQVVPDPARTPYAGLPFQKPPGFGLHTLDNW
jgi:hypothetical protein